MQTFIAVSRSLSEYLPESGDSLGGPVLTEVEEVPARWSHSRMMLVTTASSAEAMSALTPATWPA